MTAQTTGSEKLDAYIEQYECGKMMMTRLFVGLGNYAREHCPVFSVHRDEDDFSLINITFYHHCIELKIIAVDATRAQVLVGSIIVEQLTFTKSTRGDVAVTTLVNQQSQPFSAHDFFTNQLIPRFEKLIET